MSYCPECGKQVSQTQKFCKECGYNLTADLDNVAASKDSLAAPVSNDSSDSQSNVYVPQSLKCYFHPDRDSTSTCANCNKGLCSYCKTIVEGTVYCPNCVEEITKTHFQEVRIPSAARKIRLKHRARNTILISLLVLLSGGFLVGYGHVDQVVYTIIWVIGVVLWLLGWTLYAMGKGRSPWWGLLGIIAILWIGPLILMVMKDKPLKDIETKDNTTLSGHFTGSVKDAEHEASKLDEAAIAETSETINVYRNKGGKKQVFILTLIFFISVAFLGIVISSNWKNFSLPNNQPVINTPTYEFIRYTSYTHGFSILIPDSWETETYVISGSYGDNFISPSLCAGQFIAGGVNTMAIGSMSLQTYYSELMEANNDTLDGYKFISQENLTIDGIPAIRMIFTWVYEGDTMQQMNCILVRNQTAWTILGICALTCWDTYEDTFNTIVSSFQVLD